MLFITIESLSNLAGENIKNERKGMASTWELPRKILGVDLLCFSKSEFL